MLTIARSNNFAASFELVSTTEDARINNVRPRIEVFKRRWIILFLYNAYAMINSFQSLYYAVISNIIARFYGLTSTEVDWMSVIFMISYMPLVIPGSYLMDRLGLRGTALIGCGGTALGTLIKIFANDPKHVWSIYVGQTILSIMAVLIQPLPPRIAAVWFESEHISVASGIGIFGTYAGQIIGMVLTPNLLRDSDNLELVGQKLANLSYSLGGLSLIITVAVIIYFPAQPPLPPSLNEAIQRSTSNRITNKNFLRSLKKLFLDFAFMSHAIAFGITFGVGIAITTLFAQIMSERFTDSNKHVGNITLGLCACGVTSVISHSYLLDKTRKYSEIMILTSFQVITFGVMYIYGMESRSLILVYISMSGFGFAINGYIPAAYQVAIELTYPEPEQSSAGILISMGQTAGALLTLLKGFLLQNYGSFWALSSMFAFCVACTVVAIVLPNRLRRQKYVAVHQSKNKVIEESTM